MDVQYLKLAQLAERFSSDDSEGVEKLLSDDYGVDYAVPAGSPYHRGYTALHFAVESRKSESHLKALLRSGADVTLKNNDGYTPVRLAYEVYRKDGGSIPIKNVAVSLLLEAHVASGDTSNPRCPEGVSHFHIACLSNRPDAVEHFLRAKVPVNLAVNDDSKIFAGCTGLHLAILAKSRKTIKTLLEHGADSTLPNAEGRCPLQLINDGDLQFSDDHSTWRDEILELLVNSSTKSSNPLVKMGFTRFHLLCLKDKCCSSSAEWIELANGRRRDLLVAAVSHDSPMWPGYTPMHFAAHRSPQTVVALLERGASPFARDAKGTTPLDLCFERYDVAELLRILIARDDLKSVRFSNGKTVLDAMRALDSRDSLLGHLRSPGVDANAAIPSNSPLWPGATIFHLVVLLSSAATVRSNVDLCLQHGCDFAARDARGRTALHLAYYRRETNCIKSMLWSRDVASNPVDDNGLSHFHVACIVRHTRTVETLLNANVDLNARVNVDLEAIYKLDYVPFIPPEKKQIWRPLRPRRHCADTNVLIRRGSAAAHLAVVIESKWLMKEIAIRNVDPHLRDADGMTWIMRAFTSKAFAQFRPLLWKHSNALDANPVAPGGLSHLHVACHCATAAVVEALLEVTRVVDVQLSGEGVDYLKRLPEGIKPGDTPLHVAVRSGVAKKVTVLLSEGADASKKNADGLTPLHVALLNDKCAPNLITSLVDGLPDAEDTLDDAGLTKLHVAARLGDARKITRLLRSDSGVDSLYRRMKPDSPIWPGMTPLHVLIRNGYPGSDDDDEPVKLLLERIARNEEDANPDDQSLHDKPKRRKREPKNPKASKKSFKQVVDSNGLTAFHVSCMGSDEGIVEKYIKLGVDVDAATDAFATRDSAYAALHFAVKYGNDGVIETLLKHEADVDRQNLTGDTPLHLAALHRPEKISVFLRTNKFNNHIRNMSGQTVVDVLLSNNHVNVNNFLVMLNNGLMTKIDVTQKMRLVAAWAHRYSTEDFQSLISRTPDLADVDIENKNVIHHVILFSDRMRIRYDEFARNVEVLSRIDGCELEQRDIQGKTPLHHAVLLNEYRKVAALLDIGVDINVVDKSKKTPYVYCFDAENDARSTIIVGISLFNAFNVYISKLSIAGLYVSPANREYSESYLNEVDYDLTEMQRIQATPWYTLRDLLKEDIVSKLPVLPVYKRLEVLRYFNDSSDVFEVFDEWLPLFKLQHRRLLERYKLYEPVLISLLNLLGFELPDHCCEYILILLSTEDWKNIIIADSGNF